MKEKVVYWLTGSQTLYGDDVLAHVAQHSEEMANYVNSKMPVTVKYLTTCKSSDEVIAAVKQVNADDNCIGIITWCHTFSPAKMWIKGLKMLQKPMCHFATQYNEKLPYDTIDMDFMNENQAAHGDREFGYIVTRLRMDNKVIVGYYKDEKALEELASWCKVAAGYAFSKTVKVCRFSDNMRDVAVTEGDKVEAHIDLGWQVDYYPVGDLVDYVEKVTEKEIDALMAEYDQKYTMGTKRIDVVREQAKYEIAIDKFCKEKGGYIGIVDHFGALHGLNQLPGLAIQDLQGKGYGFGAEGDWKIAALGAVMQYMAGGYGSHGGLHLRPCGRALPRRAYARSFPAVRGDQTADSGASPWNRRQVRSRPPRVRGHFRTRSGCRLHDRHGRQTPPDRAEDRACQVSS